jgi:hypothetical protein
MAMTTAEAVKVLPSRICACGNPKVRKTAFCASCYGLLTHPLQQGLWHRIGKGFEAGYAAALAHLREEGRIPS